MCGRCFKVLGNAETAVVAFSFRDNRKSRTSLFHFSACDAFPRSRVGDAAMAPHRYPMISMPEAIDMVLSRAPVLPMESVPFRDAIGRVLASDVFSPRPHPPFPASIMDGYAVRSVDCPGTLRVVGASRAGAPHDTHGSVESGTAVYITTGAPVPCWADAVVPVERIVTLKENTNEQIKVDASYKPGTNVRAVGSDIALHETLLFSGDVIGPHELGIAALAGIRNAETHASPRLAVLSTGDELVDPFSFGDVSGDDDENEPKRVASGSIYDANRHMLLAMAVEAGCVTTDLGIVKDDPLALACAIQNAVATGADIIVASGGVSEGDKDYLKQVLLGEFSFDGQPDTVKGAIHFGRVLMKPGKPLTFGEIKTNTKTVLLFGLPGNPVSAAVTFALCVKPAVRRMSGYLNPHPPRIHAVLGHDIVLDHERPEYHRAVLHWPEGTVRDVQDKVDMTLGNCPYQVNLGTENLPTAISTGRQISSRLTSMKGAEVLLELPKGPGFCGKDTRVSALLIRGELGVSREMHMGRVRPVVTPAAAPTANHGVLGAAVAKTAGVTRNDSSCDSGKTRRRHGEKPKVITVVMHEMVPALNVDELLEESTIPDGERRVTDDGNDDGFAVLSAAIRVVAESNETSNSNIEGTWQVSQVFAESGTSASLATTIRHAACTSQIVLVAPSGPAGVSSQAAVVVGTDLGFPGLADRMWHGIEGVVSGDDKELNLKELADKHAGAGVGAGQVAGCVVLSVPPRNAYHAIKSGVQRMLVVPREKWEGLVL